MTVLSPKMAVEIALFAYRSNQNTKHRVPEGIKMISILNQKI